MEISIQDSFEALSPAASTRDGDDVASHFRSDSYSWFLPQPCTAGSFTGQMAHWWQWGRDGHEVGRFPAAAVPGLWKEHLGNAPALMRAGVTENFSAALPGAAFSLGCSSVCPATLSAAPASGTLPLHLALPAQAE